MKTKLNKFSNGLKESDLIKECALATFFVLAITFLIGFLPISEELQGKALNIGISDFDVYDLNYSGRNEYYNHRDTNIVIVELGESRSEIADEINLLNKYHPKVIGVDALFESANPNTNDSLGDLKLTEALRDTANIIYAFRFTEGNFAKPNFFNSNLASNRNGYVNFNGEKYSVIRTYSPFFNISGQPYESFTSGVVRIFNKEKYNLLKHRHNKQELIDYSGSIENYFSLSRNQLHEFADSNTLQRFINNKIVLLGFFVRQNENAQPPLVMEDIHFTPLNEIASGKSFPDMYGVVIHANIISMILRGIYPIVPSLLVSYLFALLFTFVFFYFIMNKYYKNRHPNHGLLILIQLASIIIVVYFFLQLFHYSLFKIKLEPIIISLVLCLELLSLYKSVSIWLAKNFKYHTIFYKTAK